MPWCILPVLALVLTPGMTHAQHPELPRGIHTYQVNGYYDGGAMEPWVAQQIVRDTTIGGKPWLALTYQSRLGRDGWIYSYTALVSGQDVISRWVSTGRMPSTCDAVRDQDRIAADMASHGKATSAALQHDAIPDFALAWLLAARPLADHDSITLHTYRCSPGAPTQVLVNTLNAVVSSGMLARLPGTAPEPVWIVRGDHSFPYHAQIAKSDRMVLKVTLPQGTAGEMVDVYTSSRE